MNLRTPLLACDPTYAIWSIVRFYYFERYELDDIFLNMRDVIIELGSSRTSLLTLLHWRDFFHTVFLISVLLPFRWYACTFVIRFPLFFCNVFPSFLVYDTRIATVLSNTSITYNTILYESTRRTDYSFDYFYAFSAKIKPSSTGRN